MKSITLSEFFEIQGYGKGKFVNVSRFAEMVGVSISYISKLLNNKYICSTNTKTYNKVKDYVGQYGYNLVSGNPIEYAVGLVQKHNNKLKLENEILKMEIARLNEIIEDFNSLAKLCKKIAKEIE